MLFSQIELHNFGIFRGTHRIELGNADGDSFSPLTARKSFAEPINIPASEGLANQSESNRAKHEDKYQQNYVLNTRSAGRNITLIGGMNGCGKTTLLDSIFLLFFGKRALRHIRDGRKSYDSLLLDYMNKSATDSTTSVSLCMLLDDDTEIRVIRSWRREGKRVPEKLIVLKDGLEDSYLADNWNFYIEELIPFGISRFFFFDNEKISQIADDESFDEIKESIKAVMGVTTIDKLIADVEKIAGEKRSLIKSPENAELIAARASVSQDIAELDCSIRKALSDSDELKSRMERVEGELEATEQLFWRQGGNLGIKREEIEREKLRLEAEESLLNQRILDLAVSSVTPLILCKDLLRQVYSENKVAEEQRALKYAAAAVGKRLARLAARVEEMVSDQDSKRLVRCLIDEELAENSPKLSENIAEALTPASSMFLGKFLERGMSEIQSAFADLRRQKEENEKTQSQIELHLSVDAEKSGALELLNAIRDLERTAAALQAEIQRLSDAVQSLENRRAALRLQEEKVNKKLAQFKSTFDNNSRILEYCSKTTAVMGEFKIRLQQKKVKELEDNITKCFRSLSRKESVITEVRVDPETLEILLVDYAGGALLKSQLSAGEKQIFAISIIWGLALSSGYRLPVIIDTPLARLDSVHRDNFINRYLPNASSQVIVLSTDEEIYGRYFHQISEYVNSCYTLYYDERENSTFIREGYFQEQCMALNIRIKEGEMDDSQAF